MRQLHRESDGYGETQESGLNVLTTCANSKSSVDVLPSASLKVILVVCFLSRWTWVILRSKREGREG